MKYVQNVHIATVKCHIADETAPKKSGRVGVKEFMFKPASTDRTSGRQLDSGYTAVEDDEYKALVKESKTFAHFTSEGQRLLVVYDDLPAEAQTPYDMLVSTRRELAAAKSQIAMLEAQLGGEVNVEAEKLKTANAELQQRIIEIGTAREELATILAKIDPAVVAAVQSGDATKETSGKAEKPAKTRATEPTTEF